MAGGDRGFANVEPIIARKRQIQCSQLVDRLAPHPVNGKLTALAGGHVPFRRVEDPRPWSPNAGSGPDLEAVRGQTVAVVLPPIILATEPVIRNARAVAFARSREDWLTSVITAAP